MKRSQTMKKSAPVVASDDEDSEYDYFEDLETGNSSKTQKFGSDLPGSESGESSDKDSVDEEEESDNMDEEESDDDEEATDGGKKDTKANKRAKLLPTKDEQLQLHNTDALMQSNLLNLQVEEMLNEVRCNKLYAKKKLQSLVNQIIGLLQTSSELNGTILSSAWAQKQNLSVDGLENHDKMIMDEVTTIDYRLPSTVECVGSFALETAIYPFVNIDLNVTMPSDMFDERDILNHKYFHKRLLYLYGLKHILTKNGILTDERILSHEFGILKGDIRKPILIMQFDLKGYRIPIRIIPTILPNTFKLVQLRLSKNNVRPKAWLENIEQSKKNKKKGVVFKQSSESDIVLFGTPHYNMAILEDVVVKSQFNFMKQSVSNCPVAREAILLFKIWVTKRNFRFDFDSFDGHTVTLFVCYLVQTRRITDKMNPINAFIIILKFIAENDLTSLRLDFMNASLNKTVQGNDVDWCELIYPLMQSTSDELNTQYNVFWRLNKGSVLEMTAECARSLVHLQSKRSDAAFQNTFMTQSNFYDRYDLFFQLNIKELMGDTVDSNGSPQNKSDESNEIEKRFSSDAMEEEERSLYDQLIWEYISAKAYRVARQALGNRAKAIRVLVQKSNCSDSSSSEQIHSVFSPIFSTSNEEKSSTAGKYRLTIGIALDKDNCSRKVDKGPATNDTENLTSFRRFWGTTKSSLRRFQDGSIIEAVVWEYPRAELVIENILKHTVLRHVPYLQGGGLGKIICKSNQLEEEYLPAYAESALSATIKKSGGLTNSDSFYLDANEKVDNLRKILIEIKNFPLLIENVSIISSKLRYTSMFPPFVHPLLANEMLNTLTGESVSLVYYPLQLVMQVEGGGKWPTKGEAIKKVKLASIVQLAEQLKIQFEIRSILHEHSLDIVYQGYVFRVTLESGMEVERRQLTFEKSYRDHESLTKDLFSKKIHALHHNAVKALHSKFPGYGRSVRLFSCWCAGHYLSNQLSQEFIETLVASVYLDPSGEHVPASASSGFQKTLSRLIAHDWMNAPLIVDFTQSMSPKEKMDIDLQFRVARDSSDKGPAMYVVSSSDKAIGYIPSLESPNSITLSIIKTHASESLSLYHQWIVSPSESNHLVRSVMRSPVIMRQCNVILNFNENLVNKKIWKTGKNEDSLMNYVYGLPFARLKLYSNLSSKELSMNNLMIESGTSPNPIQEKIFMQLNKAYGDIAMFFWDGRSASEIGVMWKPKMFLPQKFSVLHTKNRLVMMDNNGHSSNIMNVSEIVKQMISLSDGLLASANFL